MSIWRSSINRISRLYISFFFLIILVSCAIVLGLLSPWLPSDQQLVKEIRHLACHGVMNSVSVSVIRHYCSHYFKLVYFKS